MITFCVIFGRAGNFYNGNRENAKMKKYDKFRFPKMPSISLKKFLKIKARIFIPTNIGFFVYVILRTFNFSAITTKFCIP